MSNKWDEFIETPSKVFGYQVPIFTPSIYREYRGEIFTTFRYYEVNRCHEVNGIIEIRIKVGAKRVCHTVRRPSVQKVRVI